MNLFRQIRNKIFPPSYVGYCPKCGDDAWCGTYEDEDSMDCTWECLGCGYIKIEKD